METKPADNETMNAVRAEIEKLKQPLSWVLNAMCGVAMVNGQVTLRIETLQGPQWLPLTQWVHEMLDSKGAAAKLATVRYEQFEQARRDALQFEENTRTAEAQRVEQLAAEAARLKAWREMSPADRALASIAAKQSTASGPPAGWQPGSVR